MPIIASIDTIWTITLYLAFDNGLSQEFSLVKEEVRQLERAVYGSLADRSNE
jgi:hypothetical protein